LSPLPVTLQSRNTLDPQMPNGTQGHPSTSSGVQVIGNPSATHDTEVSAASTYVRIRSLSTAGCGQSLSLYLPWLPSGQSCHGRPHPKSPHEPSVLTQAHVLVDPPVAPTPPIRGMSWPRTGAGAGRHAAIICVRHHGSWVR
jgi:hypothetical protein